VVTQSHMSQPAHDLSGGVWPMAGDRSGLGLSAPEHRNAATSAVVHNRSSRAHGPPPPALPASPTHQIAPSSPQPVPSPRFQLRGGGSRRLIRAAAADLDDSSCLAAISRYMPLRPSLSMSVASAETIGGFVIVFLSRQSGSAAGAESRAVGSAPADAAAYCSGGGRQSHRRGPFGAGFCERVI
jgi:hypothetical protein